MALIGTSTLWMFDTPDVEHEIEKAKRCVLGKNISLKAIYLNPKYSKFLEGVLHSDGVPIYYDKEVLVLHILVEHGDKNDKIN